MSHTSYFSRLFGASPVKPLQQHMEKVAECVTRLKPFFEAVFKADWEEVEQIRSQISNLEREADTLKKELRLQLPKGMMMPVSRRDLLEVLRMQDNIANKTKDISGLVVGRKMSFPEAVTRNYLNYVERCVDASLQAQKTVNELDELVETGFSGKEVDLVESMINELDRIETETDKYQVDIRYELFSIEKDLPPIDVMFIYKVIEWTGDIADIAQRVGSRLQLMLAR